MLASLLSLGVVGAMATPVAAAPPERVPVIVQLQPGADVDAQAQQAEQQGGTVLYRYRTALRGFAVEIPERAIEALRRNPQVVSVERDGPVQALATQTNPPSWGLDRIDQRSLPLSASYTYPNAGAGVDAYVLDTGIRSDHVDFGNRVRSGFTAVNDRRGTQDCDGHGTHVAGTIGGATVGVAKQVDLVAVRVLNCQGSGTISGVIAGVDWTAADHAAGTPAVANMSLGGGVSSSLDTAVRNLIADGVTVTLAA
ncbi:MAG TPA: S8 family peptidase, partial [Pseudonocardia sp.]|nr:S8 family peptidase [Pseudonocardia sp.]